MNWIACRVATGKEYEIRKKLTNIDDKAEVWIPRRHYIDIVNKKAVDKSEKILPGYILIGSENKINPLLFKHFLKYVGSISEEEIVRLKAQEGMEKAIIEVGQRVLVIEGPFQGCKGTIIKHENSVVSCKLVFQGIEIPAEMKESFVAIIS